MDYKERSEYSKIDFEGYIAVFINCTLPDEEGDIVGASRSLFSR